MPKKLALATGWSKPTDLVEHNLKVRREPPTIYAQTISAGTTVLLNLHHELMQKLIKIVERRRAERIEGMQISPTEMAEFRRVIEVQGVTAANSFMEHLQADKLKQYGSRKPTRTSVLMELIGQALNNHKE